MLGIVYAIFAAITAGTADFIGGTCTRRTGAQNVVWASQAYGAALGIVWIATAQHGPPALYTGAWPIGAGLASAVGLIAFYRALSSGTMSLIAPIAALGTLVPVIWGVALGNNRLGFMQIIGIAAALAGVLLTSGGHIGRSEHATPIILACVAALSFGVSMICLAKSPGRTPVDTVVIYKLVVVAVLTTGWIARKGWVTGENRITPRRRATIQSLRPPLLSSAGMLLILGALDGTSNLLFIHAAHSGYISIVSVVASIYPVVTVILARLIHGERLKHWQQLGVTISFLGIALVAFGA